MEEMNNHLLCSKQKLLPLAQASEEICGLLVFLFPFLL